MGNLVLRVVYKKYTGNVAAFGRPLPPVPVEGEQIGRNDLLPQWRQLMNAKERIMKRSTIAKTFTIAAVTVLALGLAPTAKADDKGCTNATLSGTFAQKGSGVITAPPSIAGPMANVGTLTFDGHGAVTGALVNSLNGTIVPATEKGTYQVNPDCTGTYTVQISPLGITGHAFFVIDDVANEIQIITTDPGVVVICVARRQFQVGDWRQ
jgi:hypothetical protein